MSYYDVLRVPKNATLKEIKTAYKSLVKRYHPDIYEGNKLYAETKIKEINEAYNILTDEQKKFIYDSDLNYEEKIPYKKVSKKSKEKEFGNNENLNKIKPKDKKEDFVYKIVPASINFLKKIESKMLKEEKENFLIVSLLVSLVGIIFGIVKILYFPVL